MREFLAEKALTPTLSRYAGEGENSVTNHYCQITPFSFNRATSSRESPAKRV
jgi:hypothetical protein